jgi:hypothetical protein
MHSLADRAQSIDDDESVGWHLDYPDLCQDHNEPQG